MESYTFDDALTGSSVSCAYPGLEALLVRDAGSPAALDGASCTSLFFPGCSLVNYGLPLVKSLYDLLEGAGCVDGLSLLCCGKILSYEPDGAALRAAFECQLRDHVAAAGVRRIVAACPNCVAALRSALAVDERTADVAIVALPVELAALGYRVDADVARRMLADELGGNDVDSPLAFCVHDSCPDRATGEFADGLRALLPDGLYVEGAHNRKRSFCCGSLVRAAGKFEQANMQAQRHGDEAVDAGAAALVTACISCSFLLSTAQRRVPVFHYLELLFDWRIDWQRVDAYMKLRFLFDESLGVAEAAGGARPFVGLGAAQDGGDA